jgi:hypothetical protein
MSARRAAAADPQLNDRQADDRSRSSLVTVGEFEVNIPDAIVLCALGSQALLFGASLEIIAV